VLEGNEIPTAEGAPEIDDGDATEETLTTEPGDLAIVRIRYKDIGAVEDTPAHEVNATVAQGDVGELGDADADFRFAVAIAAFAEILKQSPYADAAHVAMVETLVKGAHEEDPERLEFQYLFEQAVPLLTPADSTDSSE
jgi:Ca-activated chloride channel homolog